MPMRLKYRLLALLLCLALPTAACADVTITALAIGDADAIVIESNGSAMLIDTGNPRDAETVLAAIADYPTLDYVVLTHPHMDHIGAFPKIADKHAIGMVVMTYAANPGVAVYDALVSVIDAHALPVWLPDVGDTITLGDATLTVYAPHPVAYSELNDTSLVLMLEAHGTRVLFCADAEYYSERDMLANEKQCPLAADVLKLGHHGKDTSSHPAFLAAVSPRIAVVTTAREPDGDVLVNLYEAGVADILSTAQGDVVISIRPDDIVYHEKE